MFQCSAGDRSTKGEPMGILKEPGNQGTSGGMMDRARTRAKEQLDNQKNRATDGLENVANIVRQSTQPLRNQHHDTIAVYVERAAEQLERLSSSLRERDVTELMRDAERFARKQPGLFLGATFAAGFMAARFLKSSTEPTDVSRRGEARWEGDSPRYEGEA
jgi:hypothetical protein